MQITEQIIERIARKVFNAMFAPAIRQSGVVGSGASVQYAVEAGHANSADNADTVDGFHATGLFRKVPNTRDINFADGNDKNGIIYVNVNADGGTTDGFWTNYGSVLNLSHTAANWQFGVDAYDVLKFRSRWWSGGDHDWTDWKTVLLNAAGTVNVGGALTGTTNLTMSGVIKIGNIYIGAQSDYIEIYKLDANNNKIAASLCAYGGVSALGVGSGGGGGGGSTTLAGLNDVTLTDLDGGQILVYDSTSNHWVNQDKTFAFANLTGSLSGAQLIAGINNLGIGSSDATGDDYLIAQYAGGNSTTPVNTNYYRRPVSKVVNATVVKAALGVGTGTTKFLREDGTWQEPTVNLNNYVTLDGNQDITGIKTFGDGKLALSGGENCDITNKRWSNGTLYNNNDSAVLGQDYAIRNAIRFRWYNTYWNIGNIRGSSTNTVGFGIALENSEGTHLLDCFRVTSSAAYVCGNTVIHSGNISGQSVNYATNAGNADTLDDFHAKRFGISYKFTASAASGGKWHRLGDYVTDGDSSVFAIDIYSGSGYNSHARQNALARIIVKDGYQTTQSATNSVGITVEQFVYDFDVKCVAVATAHNAGALWVYLPHQYPSGVYSISGIYNSWTHNSGYSDDTTDDMEAESNQEATGYFAYLDRLAGGNVTGALVKTTGHLMMLGQVDNSSTSGATQIVFGKRTIENGVVTDTQRVAISSNTNALIINPSTSSTTGQIILGVNGVGSTFGGNVGIGTAASSLYRLQVDGQIYTNNSIHVVNSAAAVFVGTSTTARISLHWASHNNNIRGLYDYTNAWLIGTDGTKSFLMKGNVGIGTDSPQYKLHVAGDIYATGGVSALSDIRQKDVITFKYAPDLNEIAFAPIIRYTMKDDEQKREHVGSIAQYWRSVMPEAVNEAKDGTLSMQYGVIALTSVIALAREVRKLKAEINRLKNK